MLLYKVQTPAAMNLSVSHSTGCTAASASWMKGLRSSRLNKETASKHSAGTNYRATHRVHSEGCWPIQVLQQILCPPWSLACSEQLQALGGLMTSADMTGTEGACVSAAAK